MIEQADREAAAFFERWPGYNEQSWAERFAELDRRHTALTVQLYAALTNFCPTPVESGTTGE